jgi:hypothetical protein
MVTALSGILKLAMRRQIFVAGTSPAAVWSFSALLLSKRCFPPAEDRGQAMKVDGGCHCGKIRYEAEVDPAKVVVCHCTDCQTLSGSAFRVVVPANEGSFRLLSGEPKVYIKTGESGNKREQTFCPDCGTPIYSAPATDGTKVVGLRVGTLLQRDQLVPRDQFWYRSAQAWLQSLPAIHRREKQPTFDAKGGFGNN